MPVHRMSSFFLPIPTTILQEILHAGSMAACRSTACNFQVRRGESLNFAAIYKFHPMFTKEKFHIWNDGSEKDGFPLEGGDIFSLRKDFVMIGFSERTSLHGVETLAYRLFSQEQCEAHFIGRNSQITHHNAPGHGHDHGG